MAEFPAETDEPDISSAFDSGNIDVKAIETRDGATVFRLAIRPDAYTAGTDNKTHRQWFHFRASNVRGRRCVFRIENIDETSFGDGFINYTVVSSYDREYWWRCRATTYKTAEDEARGFAPLSKFQSGSLARAAPAPAAPAAAAAPVLEWTLTPEHASVWFAYWTPYSFERHMSVVAELARARACGAHRVVGRSLDGRPLDMLVFGDGPAQLWLAARQHPGESMAEWLAEGFARRLADADDPKARALLARATVRVIPNMNPDGSVRGYLRTNAGGANLNREWAGGVYPGYDAPTLARSPEVNWVGGVEVCPRG